MRHLNGVEWSAVEASVRMQWSIAQLWKRVQTIGETRISLRIFWSKRNEPAHASEVNYASTLMSETGIREPSRSALDDPGAQLEYVQNAVEPSGKIANDG